MQGCRARLLGKAAGQGCRARLPGKAAGQGCRARLPGKEACKNNNKAKARPALHVVPTWVNVAAGVKNLIFISIPRK
jgi:hypothetical protein